MYHNATTTQERATASITSKYNTKHQMERWKTYHHWTLKSWKSVLWCDKMLSDRQVSLANIWLHCDDYKIWWHGKCYGVGLFVPLKIHIARSLWQLNTFKFVETVCGRPFSIPAWLRSSFVFCAMRCLLASK